MSDEGRAERESIQPDDWPLEEGQAPAQPGLRNDIGASQGTPKSAPPDDAPDAGEGAGDRGPLGTETPTSKGAEQGPR
jgi:hypothetical protein